MSVGLFAFKNITCDPHNRRALRLVFTEKVKPIHEKQLLDALHAWMLAQKMIAENNGVAPTPEQVTQQMAALKGQVMP